MTFKEIIFETFGTIEAFGEFLGCARQTASKYFYEPGGLTIAEAIRLSDKTGIPVCDVVQCIVTSIATKEKLGKLNG